MGSSEEILEARLGAAPIFVDKGRFVVMLCWVEVLLTVVTGGRRLVGSAKGEVGAILATKSASREVGDGSRLVIVWAVGQRGSVY